MLNETQKKTILDKYQQLNLAGKLLSPTKLNEYYKRFLDNFGPQELQRIDGEELLTKIHDFSTRESLVYWLEFKNDDEFPSNSFGSIAGGSALKYKIYKNKDTGEWTTGSPTKQWPVSLDEAINVVREQKSQLIRGYEILEQLPDGASDEEYQKLQRDLEHAAPDLADLGWVHKFWSLLFPEKLDYFHIINYQRFFLLKLLENPSKGTGRYENAGRFVRIARELELPLITFTTILKKTFGSPHKYWKVGTTIGPNGESKWEEMKNGGFVSIGWQELGNLSHITRNKESKDKIKEMLRDIYPKKDPRGIGNDASQVFNFVTKIEENDIIIASKGAQGLGIGRVKNEGYYFDDKDIFSHKIPVDWLSLEAFHYSEHEGLQTTVCELKKYKNIIEFESRLKGKQQLDSISPDFQMSRILHDRIEEIRTLLERKKQVILYGPPGTGKTYWASQTVNELTSFYNFNKPYTALTDEEKKEYIFRCTFHPAFGYEEFIEGYYPKEEGGNLIFVQKPGIFKNICLKAKKHPDKKFYLIIDEINRGDIPRIFGELISLLEKNKRGGLLEVTLPGGELFSVPDNVYIVGTMNTADRSIALLDIALRRRFGFIELMPDSAILKSSGISQFPLSEWLDSLNNRICENLGLDSRNLQIGHAYFIENEKPIDTLRQFKRIFKEDIIPLIQEYCYENYHTLENILGKGFIDSKRLQIKTELFNIENEDDLIQAIVEPLREILTTNEATLSDEKNIDFDDTDENEQQI